MVSKHPERLDVFEREWHHLDPIARLIWEKSGSVSVIGDEEREESIPPCLEIKFFASFKRLLKVKFSSWDSVKTEQLNSIFQLLRGTVPRSLILSRLDLEIKEEDRRLMDCIIKIVPDGYFRSDLNTFIPLFDQTNGSWDDIIYEMNVGGLPVLRQLFLSALG